MGRSREGSTPMRGGFRVLGALGARDGIECLAALGLDGASVVLAVVPPAAAAGLGLLLAARCEHLSRVGELLAQGDRLVAVLDRWPAHALPAARDGAPTTPGEEASLLIAVIRLLAAARAAGFRLTRLDERGWGLDGAGVPVFTDLASIERDPDGGPLGADPAELLAFASRLRALDDAGAADWAAELTPVLGEARPEDLHGALELAVRRRAEPTPLGVAPALPGGRPAGPGTGGAAPPPAPAVGPPSRRAPRARARSLAARLAAPLRPIGSAARRSGAARWGRRRLLLTGLAAAIPLGIAGALAIPTAPSSSAPSSSASSSSPPSASAPSSSAPSASAPSSSAPSASAPSASAEPTADAGDPGRDGGAGAPEGADPVAAAALLLRTARGCGAPADPCWALVLDAEGLVDRTQLAGLLGAADGPGPVWTLASRTGDAALLTSAAPGMSPETAAASLLLVQGEAGWRIRAVFAETGLTPAG